MVEMPPLPAPAPLSIKVTIEHLAALLGLRACSHGDLGLAFGDGPVLTTHEAAKIIHAVIDNLRAHAREQSAIAERAVDMLANVVEILHRAWPEHVSGDPEQLARAAAEAISSAEAMRAETIAESRERAKADALELERTLESLRVARLAEGAAKEQLDELYNRIECFAGDYNGEGSCLDPHSDRFGRAVAKLRRLSSLAFPPEEEVDALKPASEIDAPSPAATPAVLHVGGPLRRGSELASGLDLPISPFSIVPGRTIRIKTGIRVSIPEGYEGQVRPRSSAMARGLLVHLGTIDADFRGEIEIVVTNLGGEWLSFAKPVAQLVICPVARPTLEQVETLDETTRGEGGFGSSDALKKGGA